MTRDGFDRLFVVLGALSAFIGVAAGAFGAHALKARLAPDLLAIFETGSRYQLMHALALLAVAWACDRWPGAGGPLGRLVLRGRNACSSPAASTRLR